MGQLFDVFLETKRGTRFHRLGSISPNMRFNLRLIVSITIVVNNVYCGVV